MHWNREPNHRRPGGCRIVKASLSVDPLEGRSLLAPIPTYPGYGPPVMMSPTPTPTPTPVATTPTPTPVATTPTPTPVPMTPTPTPVPMTPTPMPVPMTPVPTNASTP